MRREPRVFTTELTARSTASAPALFALVADGTRWAHWARPLVSRSSWERTGEPPPGGVGAIRLVGRWPVFVREETVAYEQDRRHEYALRTPAPLLDYRAEVRLAPLPTGGTDVTWRIRFTERFLGTGPLLRLTLRTVVRFLLRRLVRAAERAGRS